MPPLVAATFRNHTEACGLDDPVIPVTQPQTTFSKLNSPKISTPFKIQNQKTTHFSLSSSSSSPSHQTLISNLQSAGLDAPLLAQFTQSQNSTEKTLQTFHWTYSDADRKAQFLKRHY